MKLSGKVREAITRYLVDHPAHDGYFSRNVKLWSLNLPSDCREQACRLVDNADPMTFARLQRIMDSFGLEHNVSVQFGGRSNGHIELHVSPDQYDGGRFLKDWSDEELQWLFRLVKAFDRMTDRVIEEFIDIARNTEYVEVLRFKNDSTE